MAKEKEDYFGLPHGEKDTPQLRARFKNYVAHNEKHGGFGPGDRADKYRLQRHNSFYEFNKPEYDSKKKSTPARSKALEKKKGPKFYAEQMRQHGGFPKSEIKRAEKYEREKNI